MLLEDSREDRRREQHIVIVRAIVASGFVLLGIALILLQLLHLQVEQHEHFSVLSKENRVKIQPVAPARGLIYDANGTLLADNHPSFSLEITPENVTDVAATIDALSRIIAITDQDRERFDKFRRKRMRFQGVPIRQNLTPAEVARFAVDSHQFPGVEVRAELIRTYPLGEETAHVLGYVGRINERDFTRIDAGNYAGTNFIGKTGIERWHEDLLHGRVGHQQVEVNARGRILRTLDNTPPAPGRDLLLFLDIRLQQIARAALQGRRGAVVAIDTRTGGVLAMASNPSFDPNLFVQGIGQATYDALLYSPDKPLFNRAIRGQYPPGSTVKPFVGLGGLASGIVNRYSVTFCPGYFTLPGQKHRFRCWSRGGHGRVDLREGIVQSCDVYFYWLANQMGITRIKDFLGQFSFGERTGVDVAGELGGLLPSREWKQRVRKRPWYPGETLIVGIGQGAFLATPMQLAVATATIANRGRFITPRLARASRLPGALEETPLPMTTRQIEAGGTHHWEEVIEDMAQVVEHGTGKRIRSPDYRIAGKTGTAQVFSIGQKERYNAATTPERMRDHALFIAFAPVAEPRIAVAVIVENGEHGSTTAAPVARRVIDAYLGGRPLPLPKPDVPEAGHED